jgi:hypothetical protein
VVVSPRHDRRRQGLPNLEKDSYRQQVQKMMWFSASLFFSSIPRGQTDPILWEDSVALLRAPSPSEAERMAAALGVEREHAYRNANGEMVEWKFVRVQSVFEIEADELVSGMEVFSRYLKPAEAESLLTKMPE